MSKCMYTTQGEIICGGPTKEQFVSEKPNMDDGKKPNSTSEIVDSALQQEYCDISISTDPATGKVQYNFKKECQAPKKA